MVVGASIGEGLGTLGARAGLGALGLAALVAGAPVARGAAPTPSALTRGELTPAKTSQCGYHRGFFVRTGDGASELRLGGRVQGRLELGGADKGGVTKARLLLRRVRVTLLGHVFDPRLAYELQVGLGEGDVALKDAWVQYALSERWARLRLGQFKRPFSREQMTSSAHQSFVDRAATDGAFGAGRDVGLMLASDPHAAGVELSAGIFNGTGAKGELSAPVRVDPATGLGSAEGGDRSNVPDLMHPALVARVGYESNGLRGYSEGDLRGGGWRFGVAASGRVDLDGDGDGATLLAGEIDYVVKAHGFDTTGALYAQRRAVARGEGAARTVTAATDVGGHVQAGYTFGGQLQSAVRYAVVTPEGEGARREASVAVSVLRRGHELKWQTDATWSWGPAGEDPAWLVRSQVQLAF